LENIDPEDSLTVSTEPTKQPIPQWLRKAQGLPDDTPVTSGPFGSPSAVVGTGSSGPLTKELSREKLDAFLLWLDLLPTPPDRLIVWCRFRPELIRTTKALQSRYPKVLNLWGGQTPDERREVKKLLAPGSTERGAVVGISGTGAASLNFSGANIMVFMSHDPALIKRTQSIGRIERPGQTQPMLIVDVVARGPKGQKTYDHRAISALRSKQDMSTWTVNQWRAILMEE
jgi:hypothetical protein